MSDIAAIAGKLSEAQRDQVLRGSISGDGTMQTARALIRKGMMYLRIDSPNGRCGFVELTPLGLQVRDHLISKEML